ncbi:MAG: glycosyl hydrolase, partial [Pseudomonadota bacterium]
MRRQILAGAVVALLALATRTQANVMLGAFVPGNGWHQENIHTLNDQLHKKLSFITLFSAFTEDWDQLYWQASKVADAGMVPMISWMPIDQKRKDHNILPEITDGLWDDYLLEWSRRFMEWRNSYAEDSRPDILLRFGHEFNGNWYSYSDSPDAYQQAYRYVHNLFQQQGVNDYIEWVWCANNLNIDSVNDVTRYYPGDAYVDWTSIDGYNWGTNYSWTSWESFTEVYANAYSTLVTHYPDKPILIAEFG